MDAFKYFPKSLVQWGLNYILIQEEEKIPTAGVKYDPEKERFVMLINPTFWKGLGTKDRRKLIAHEVSHILRGDVFVSEEKFNPNLSNIAQDALINEVLAIEKIGDIEGWTVERIKSQLSPERREKLNLHFLPGWQYIYNLLKEEQQELLSNLSNLLNDVISSPPTEKAKDIIAEGILKSRTGAKDDNQNGNNQDNEESEIEQKIKEITNEIIRTSMAGDQRGFRKDFEPQTKPNPTLLALIKSIEQVKKGKRFKRRTYRREGVVPEIKGCSRIPTLDVLVALDISGSVLDRISEMGGLVQYLKQKQLTFQFGTFSDTWRVYPRMQFHNLEGFGGGTCVKELFNYIKKVKPTVAIIITDGELYDFDQSFLKISTPIIWVFTHQIVNDLLKPNDKAILLK